MFWVRWRLEAGWRWDERRFVVDDDVDVVVVVVVDCLCSA